MEAIRLYGLGLLHPAQEASGNAQHFAELVIVVEYAHDVLTPLQKKKSNALIRL